MGKGIKGITVEIGGDTTKLGNALAGINSKTKSLQSELKGVNTLLKMDPGNVTLLAQKQEILTQAISETKNKLDLLKKSQAQVEKQFENGEIGEDQYRDFQREIVATEQKLNSFTKELDEMGDEANKSGKKLDELGDEADDAEKKLDEMGDEADDAGKKLDDAGNKGAEFGEKLKTAGSVAIKGLTAVASAIGATVTALGAASVSSAAYADEILTMSTVTGVSTDKLQELAYASELVDVDVQTVTKSMAKNIKSMSSAQDGSKAYAEAYKELGISITDTNGELRDGETVYWECIDALGAIENETERDAIAMQLFGKSAQELNPLIETGSENMKEFAEEAHAVGAVLSEDALAAFGAFDDSIQRLKASAKAAKNSLGSVLLPELQALTDAGTDLLNEFTTQLNEAGGGLDGFAKTLKNMSGSIGDELGSLISDILSGVVDFLPAIGEVLISALKTITSMLPQLVESGATIIGGLIQGILNALPQLAETGLTVINTILTSLSELFPQIAASLNETIPQLVNVIVSMTPTLLQSFSEMMNSLASSLATLIPTLANSIVSMVPVLMQGLITMVNSIASSINTLLPPLIAALPVIIEGICRGLVEDLPQLIQGICDMLIMLVGHADEFAQALIPMLPVIITQLCTALSQNIPILVETCITLIGMLFTQILPAVLVEIAKAIPEILAALITGITSIFTAVLTTIAEWGEQIGTNAREAGEQFINGVVETVQNLPEKVGEFLTQVASKVSSWGTDLAAKGKEAATKLYTAVTDKVNEIVGKVKSIGANITEGLWNGITSKYDWLVGKIKGFCSDVTEDLKSFFGIKSPSRVMRDEVGKHLVTGIIAGINAEKDNAKKSARELGELYLKEIESTIKKKQDYKEILIGDEIFLWEELLAKFEKGSDNYKDVEIKLFNAHKQYVEDERKLDNMSIQDEITYWSNLTAACEEGSVLYKYALEQVNEAKKEYEDNYVKSHEDYLKSVKETNDVSLTDEILYWDKILDETDRNSKNYSEVQKKLVEAHKNYVADMRKNNEMSVQDEMVYWVNLSATCEEGTAAYKTVTDLFSEAYKEYETDFVDSHADHIKEQKELGKMSLADEVSYWKKLLKITDRNSKNYIKIQEKISESEKSLSDKTKELREDYAESSKSIMDKLRDDIQSVRDAYDNAVDSRRKSIVSSMGLFDAFKPSAEIDKYTLADNLASQVDALKEWDSTLDALSRRKGLKDSDLLGDLQNMSVDSLYTLQQINAMTDEELQNYIKLYDEKNKVALERATVENEKLKEESRRQIKQLTIDAQNKMDELKQVYKDNLDELGLNALAKAKPIGQNIVLGIMDGIMSKTATLQSYMTNFLDGIVSNAQTALGIQSPSRVFADLVGKQIPAGIAKGILDNSGVANKAIKDMTGDLADEASLMNGATITRRLNTTFSANFGNGRTLTDVMDTIVESSNKIYDRLNSLQIVLDSGVLVGETIDKIDAGLANRQILTARGL